MQTPNRMYEWTSIATPPNTAREVLAWYLDNRTDNQVGFVHMMLYASGKWYRDGNMYIGTEWPEPSHWRDIPAGPGEETQDEIDRRAVMAWLDGGCVGDPPSRWRYLCATCACVSRKKQEYKPEPSPKWRR